MCLKLEIFFFVGIVECSNDYYGEEIEMIRTAKSMSIDWIVT